MIEKEVLAPKYMKKFRCIGGACESSCCQWWRVDIDRDNFKDLKRVMSSSPVDRAKFRESVKRNRSGKNDNRHFAKINLCQETNFCPFVDPKGLCEIHSRFGEDYLCLTCRTYPRMINDVFGKLSAGAVLSCPEVARRCLLDPEGTSLVMLGSQEFNPSGLALAGRCDDSSLPFNRYVEEIRQIFFEILSARQYPIVARLFFLAYLSSRVSLFFNKSTRQSDFNENQLADEVERLSSPGMLDELFRRYNDLETSMELPLNFINSILSAKNANPISGNLFKGIFSIYGFTDDDDLSPQAVRNAIEIYHTRREKVGSLYRDQIEIYFENFCRNHAFLYLYTNAPSLLVFVENMLFRLAIAAFIFFSHPDFEGILEGQAVDTSRKKTIDAIIVDSIFKFSRSIEHDTNLWHSIQKAMMDSKLHGLPYMVQLLKFIA